MRKWILFLLAVSEPLPVEVAAINHDFLRGRELKVPQKKVSICHYNARLGKFKMVEVPESQLKNHIGIHGPAVGYKDMTVADANELLYPSSYDCSCVSTNLGDGLNCIESELICHYDARVGMFSMIEIPKAELKDHIGIHGPAVGYKDMTVEDANELPHRSVNWYCRCAFGYGGDGLNCVETPNAASATCHDEDTSFSTLAGVPYVITWDLMSSKGSFWFEYGVVAATPYDLQVFHDGKLLFHDPAVVEYTGVTLSLRSSSKSTTIKTVFTGTDPGYGGVYMGCAH
ncbi:hypothetical protein MHU86_14067 [Fragilaria crotonensis]|nr:hypothetical protein MHU86_14067 [Fragilaria crotonensis]